MRIASGVAVRGAFSSAILEWQKPVLDKDLTAPPGSPGVEDRYIVASVATGAWATHEDDIAEWNGTAWIFSTPAAGWAVYIADESEAYFFDGTNWNQESFGPHAVTHKGGGTDEIASVSTTLAGLMAAADKVILNNLGGLFTVIRTADDIEAILEAASDFSTFYLEDGTHTTAGLITITSKKAISIFGGPGAVITRSGSEKIFRIEGCQDFRMEGFSISVAGGASDSIIDIVDAGAGSYQTPTRHKYSSLHFDVTSGDVWGCINVIDAFLQGSVKDCTFSGAVATALLVGASNCSGLIFADNQIVSTYSGGTGLDLSTLAGVGMLIAGNYIEGPFVEGIALGNSENAIIRDNTIRGVTSKGIDCAGNADRAEVSGNTIYDSGGIGIQCSSSHAIIQSNEIYSAAGDGIQLASSTQTHVADNMLENGAAWGISADASCANCSFANNHFNSNASGNLNLLGTNEHTIGDKTNNRLSTTDATQTTIATIPIPDDTAAFIIFHVTARLTNAAGRACYIRRALYYREAAGAPGIQGTINTEFTRESLTLWDATFVVSGNNVLIQVKGRAGDDVNWDCLHTVQERS